MGSRGSFLDSGGFSKPARWETVDFIDGVEVLAPKDKTASIGLPERSNSPGVTYVIYRKDGLFKQLATFGCDRLPIYEIDYGYHDSAKSLHVHFFSNGSRKRNIYGREEVVYLHNGDELYEKYRKFFGGIYL